LSKLQPEKHIVGYRMKIAAIIATGVAALLFLECSNGINKENKPAVSDSIISLKKDTSAVIKEKLPDSSCKIYITIDDGPDRGSYNIQRIALADSAKINVFIVGRQVYKSDSLGLLFQSFQLNPFIEIGSHSYSHAQLHYRRYYKKLQSVIRDFKLNADTLHLQNKIVRLPGRNTWRIHNRKRSDLPDDAADADSLASEGYSIFGWDIEWRDFPENSHTLQSAGNMMRQIENMIRENKSFTSRNIIILVHDTSFISTYNTKQLEVLIGKIKEKKDYRLEFLSNYP
jgi:peptidoglycan/xylan/chitin deacetylase (PgdA/CDA1 family)